MALNFSLDSLMEQSLLSDDPWWRYILDGAGWTVGLAVSAFLLFIPAQFRLAIIELRPGLFSTSQKDPTAPVIRRFLLKRRRSGAQQEDFGHGAQFQSRLAHGAVAAFRRSLVALHS